MNFVLSKIIQNSRYNTVVIPALFKTVVDIKNGANQQNTTSDQQSFPICNVHFPHKVICVPQFGFSVSQAEIENNAFAKSCREKLHCGKRESRKCFHGDLTCRFMPEISSAVCTVPQMIPNRK